VRRQRYVAPSRRVRVHLDKKAFSCSEVSFVLERSRPQAWSCDSFAPPAIAPIENSRRTARSHPPHPSQERPSRRGQADTDHVLQALARLETRADSLPRSRASECPDRWLARRGSASPPAPASNSR